MQGIVKALSTPTAKSTGAFYVGSFAQNVLRYFFHLILLKLLTPPEYGEFLSYLSLIYLLSIPMGTIATLITKFVSEFEGKGDKVSTNLFFHYLLKTISPLTLVLGAMLIVLSTPLALIFKASNVAFIVLGISMLISLLQTIIGSYLLAFQKFIFQTAVGFINIFLTIILSIIFVKIGLSATGVVIGQLLAGVISTLIIFLNIKKAVYPKLVTKKSPTFSLRGYTGYSFVYSLGTMSLIATDILTVRFFLDPHLSGIYSSLSILGRMILFALTPLIGIVLPIASHRHAVTGSAKSVLIKIGTVMLTFGILGAGVFSLFPSLIIRVLSGPSYLDAVPYLSIYAFTMVFFAISQLLLSYSLAIGRPKANLLLLVATISQPILIYLFKDTFSLIVWSNFGLQLTLLASLGLFLISKKD